MMVRLSICDQKIMFKVVMKVCFDRVYFGPSTPLFKLKILPLRSMFMCRVSKDYYAALLGGIMLSIGVQLSVADFAIVLKRYCIFLK
jgi:hypothetical protein